MVRTQIQLSEDQAKAVKTVAIAQGISAAEVIRRAIDTVIQSPSLLDATEKRKKVLEIVGKFNSGKSDISIKHDDYLAETFLQ
jgi:hypothetical protein